MFFPDKKAVTGKLLLFLLSREALFHLDIFIIVLKEVINNYEETFVVNKVFTFVNS